MGLETKKNFQSNRVLLSTDIAIKIHVLRSTQYFSAPRRVFSDIRDFHHGNGTTRKCSKSNSVEFCLGVTDLNNFHKITIKYKSSLTFRYVVFSEMSPHTVQKCFTRNDAIAGQHLKVGRGRYFEYPMRLAITTQSLPCGYFKVCNIMRHRSRCPSRKNYGFYNMYSEHYYPTNGILFEFFSCLYRFYN